MENKINIVIGKAGGVTALAKALGIQHQSIYSWRKIPIDRVADIERITGISRHELRPDIFGDAA